MALAVFHRLFAAALALLASGVAARVTVRRDPQREDDVAERVRAATQRRLDVVGLERPLRSEVAVRGGAA